MGIPLKIKALWGRNVSAPRNSSMIIASVSLVFILCALLTLTLAPYGGNPSALFHIDQNLASEHPMPVGTVVLSVPGYDGMEYYQIARNVPIIFDPTRWEELIGKSPGAYAYQRFLLPLVAYIFAAGNAGWLPISFLAIEILSIIGSLLLVLRWSGKLLPAFGLALCPAMMVALHFSLAEPLSILLLTAFLVRYMKRSSIGFPDLLLLSLFVLGREINIFFVVILLALSAWRKQWRDAFLLIVPLVGFTLLHTLIYGIFGDFPFFLSTEKSTFPFQAILELLAGGQGYNRLTLTSIPLFLFFVLPACVSVALFFKTSRRLDGIAALLALFLLVMLMMPDHIWGSITSIGRVITPVYPLFIVHATEHPTILNRAITVSLIVIGLSASLALASVIHPFTIV